jgi:hypothetical protein
MISIPTTSMPQLRRLGLVFSVQRYWARCMRPLRRRLCSSRYMELPRRAFPID